MSRCASLGISLNISSAAALQVILACVLYIVVTFAVCFLTVINYSLVLLNLKDSLNCYKGITSDDSCSRLEKMILVSLCSRIMNVSIEVYASWLPIILFFLVGLLLCIQWWQGAIPPLCSKCAPLHPLHLPYQEIC